MRKLFYKDRLLLAALARCAAATILELYGAIFPDNHFRPGIIASTQTFGDLLIWHPHIHCLATDGVFDLAGSFHPVPGIDSDQATILFREKVFAMMKENNRISDGLVENMRNWHHSGFSVHNEVVINENDREALGRLAQYVVHASFSAEKIRYVEKKKLGTDCYFVYLGARSGAGRRWRFAFQPDAARRSLPGWQRKGQECLFPSAALIDLSR